jgi:hypothetical protein
MNWLLYIAILASYFITMRISDKKKGNLTEFYTVMLTEKTGGKMLRSFFFQGRVLLQTGVRLHEGAAAGEYAASGGVQRTGGVSR